MISKLKDLLARAAKWPEEAQAELAEIGFEIDAEQRGEYHATSDELKAIDQALAQISRGETVPEEEVEAFFARMRGA
jgi:hypothetical protein